MQVIGGIFDTLIVHPIINVLVAIYQVLIALQIPYSLGFSIIVLTILIRLVLYPLISQQLKVSKKMQEIAPHISNLREKHKGDNKMLQQETMKLYKEFGVNPAAGCLPTLLQLPIIWGLYSVLDKLVKFDQSKLVDYVNGIVVEPIKLTAPWDPTFFGVQLGQSPSNLLNSLGALVILIPIITGLFQFIQSKMLFKTSPKSATKKEPDFATAFQTQTTYIFPAMIALFSFTLPVGLSLYWNTFTIFGIIQQYKIMGWGGMEQIWQKIRRQ